MKLYEAISENNIQNIKEQWPSGINFKNKSTFVGITHPTIEGVKDILIPMSAIESDKWGISFHKMDKEFISMIEGIFNSLGASDAVDKSENHRRKAEYEALINHPCKSKCDAWHAGYKVALKDVRDDLEYLHRLCGYISEKKTRSRGFYISQFRDAFEKYKSRGFFK